MKVAEFSLTNYCNFKCKYCISDDNRGNDKFAQPLKLDENGNLKIHQKGLSEEEIAKRDRILKEAGQEALDFYVKKEQEKYELDKNNWHDYGDFLDFNTTLKFIHKNLLYKWVIVFTGGEPLYIPHFDALAKAVIKTNKIVITSNLSLLQKQPGLLELDPKKVIYRIGYHPEFRSLTQLKNNVKTLDDYGYKYIVNYVLHPEYYESGKYLEHIKFLEDNHMLYEVTQFSGKYNGVTYPRILPARKTKLDEIYDDKYEIDGTSFGKDFIFVTTDGTIYECEGKHKVLGNIYDDIYRPLSINHSFCVQMIRCPVAVSCFRYLNMFDNM